MEYAVEMNRLIESRGGPIVSRDLEMRPTGSRGWEFTELATQLEAWEPAPAGG